MSLQLYDQARTAIRKRGFDPDVQTKIALFVGAAKLVNATIMAAFEAQPQVTTAFPFVHGQYFREMEFATMLGRVTRWSPNPRLYVEGTELAGPLWREWWQLLAGSVPPWDVRVTYAGLALGHALLARVRLSPVLPDEVDELDPFVVAVRRIEQESGRMIQAQIRLLKDGVVPLSVEECEEIMEAKQAAIDAAFARFLRWLAGEKPESTGLWTPFAAFGAGASGLPFVDAGSFMRGLAATARGRAAEEPRR
jgi:hypothetical protein